MLSQGVPGHAVARQGRFRVAPARPASGTCALLRVDARPARAWDLDQSRSDGPPHGGARRGALGGRGARAAPAAGPGWRWPTAAQVGGWAASPTRAGRPRLCRRRRAPGQVRCRAAPRAAARARAKQLDFNTTCALAREVAPRGVAAPARGGPELAHADVRFPAPQVSPVCGAHGRGVAAPLTGRALDSGRVAHSARRRPCACQRAREGGGDAPAETRTAPRVQSRRVSSAGCHGRPPRLAQRHVRRREARSLSRRAAGRGRLAAITLCSPRGAGSSHVQMRSARGRTSSSIAEGRDRRSSYLAAAAQQASPRKLQRGRTVTRYAPVT